VVFLGNHNKRESFLMMKLWVKSKNETILDFQSFTQVIDVLLFVFCSCAIISLLKSCDFMVNIRVLIYVLNVFIGFQLFAVS
jgi:hypothetical protein